MRALVLAVWAASPALGTPPPPAVYEALVRSAVRPELRLVLESYEPKLPPTCEVTRAQAPLVKGSGRVAVHLFGKSDADDRCEGWAWVSIRAMTRALVLSRAVVPGEGLASEVRVEEREVRPGHDFIASLPEGAVANRSLPAGTALRSEHLWVGPALNSAIRVRLVVGDIKVEQSGRRAACAQGRFCAALANGKRVEGRWDGEALWVEAR